MRQRLREHTSAYVSIRQQRRQVELLESHRMRQRLREHTSAYVSIRQQRRQVELLESHRMRQRLEERVASVFLLFYQLLRQYWYFSTRQAGRAAQCGLPAAASVLVL